MAYKRFTKSASQLRPDTRYDSKLLAKFINCVMWDGKKTAATSVVYDALDIVQKQVSDKTPLEVFEEAVNRVRPNIQVRSKRVGGSNYQVPVQVGPARQTTLAIRWIIQAARQRKGRPTCESLARELLDAHKGEGTAFTQRENVHRMADANKAFAHFAW